MPAMPERDLNALDWKTCLSLSLSPHPRWRRTEAHHPSALPNGSVGKESACNAGDPGLISVLERSPEKGMDTHSSILAWRIPWSEEPGELQSMDSQRVRTTQWMNTLTTCLEESVEKNHCSVLVCIWRWVYTQQVNIQQGHCPADEFLRF